MAQITLTIPDSKLDEFKKGFLAAYKNGKQLLAQQAAAIDNEIVQ